MKMIHSKFFIVIALLIPLNNYAQNIVTTDDLQTLVGEWTGSLTYMDYSTNNPYTMPANVIVQKGKKNNQFILNINYPKEANANSKDKIKLSKDGKQLNNHEINSKVELPNGSIQITTQYSGKDNGKKALIKNIYIIGTSEFIIRKEVKFENSTDWLVRNEYTFSR